MDDLEICKRIAEIEGLKTWQHPNGELYIDAESYEKMYIFNPLTDDALCFQLMVKYKVSGF